MLRRPSTSDFKRRRVRLKRTVHTLLTPEQMNQAIIRESARVDRRSGAALTLVLFRVPGAQRRSLSALRLAKTIVTRIRVTDDVGWFDEQHMGLLLPDTPAAGAWRLAQDICDSVARRGARPQVTMYSYPADARDPAQCAGILRSEEQPQAPVEVPAAVAKVAS